MHSTLAVFCHPSEFLLGVEVPRVLLGIQFRDVYEPVSLLYQLCNLCLPSGFHNDIGARRSLKELMIVIVRNMCCH